MVNAGSHKRSTIKSFAPFTNRTVLVTFAAFTVPTGDVRDLMKDARSKTE
jgi:hypothetical protein